MILRRMEADEPLYAGIKICIASDCCEAAVFADRSASPARTRCTECMRECEPVRYEVTEDLSACCRAPVTVEGRTTHYWKCTGCGQACDTAASAIQPLLIKSCHDIRMAEVNHSWKHDGDPQTALTRTCGLCGAAGARLATPRGLTRWETRLEPDGPWSTGRVPPCPAPRRGAAYTPVSLLLKDRLAGAGIVPVSAAVTMERVRGDWRMRPTPEHPSWLAKWDGPDGPQMVFSCYPMRRCAEAPQIRMEGDQVVPCDEGERR